MGVIVGFFAVIALLAVGIYFSIRPTDYRSDRFYTGYDYEYEKRKALFDVTEKNLRLNLMQMRAYKAMEEAAERHSERTWELSIFDEDRRR